MMKHEETNSDREGLSGLQALIERAENSGRPTPPVEKWNPQNQRDLDIVIKKNGAWFYQGTPINRDALVRLFSTVLRRDDDGKTYLVTPFEKIGISVEDAHFIAVEMNADDGADGPILTFRTNVGDVVEASAAHPLRFVINDEDGGVKPYLHIRGGLEALASRPVMHELISHGAEIAIDGRAMFAIRSGGAVFPIMPADKLQQMVEAR